MDERVSEVAPSAAAAERPRLATAMGISLAATTLGLARFGYSVLLPAMRTDLHWSYTQAGGMNAAHGVGYLIGSLVTPVPCSLLGIRRTFMASFAVAAASILASGFTTSYPLLLLLRVLAGSAGAVLFIAGATLAAQLATVSRSPGLVLGIYFAGVAPGILLSAILAPMILSSNALWHTGWIVMGLAAVLLAIVGSWVLREFPTLSVPTRRELPDLKRLRWGILAFALFGFGYISYMTFIVAYWREVGQSVSTVTVFWLLLALGAGASGWLWHSLLDQLPPGRSLTVLLSVTTTAVAVSLLSHRPAILLVSAVLFGSGFLSVSAAMTQLVRSTLPPHQWVLGLTVILSLFALGQVLGPLVTGLLADYSGSLWAGLALSAGLLAMATCAASRQQPRKRWRQSGQMSSPGSVEQ